MGAPRPQKITQANDNHKMSGGMATEPSPRLALGAYVNRLL
jgi:hypothetical protein